MTLKCQTPSVVENQRGLANAPAVDSWGSWCRFLLNVVEKSHSERCFVVLQPKPIPPHHEVTATGNLALAQIRYLKKTGNQAQQLQEISSTNNLNEL